MDFFYEAVNCDELVRNPSNAFFERQSKKLQRQGARSLTTEAYFRYAAGRRGKGTKHMDFTKPSTVISELQFNRMRPEIHLVPELVPVVLAD
jgi:hypothetical protein